MKLKGFLIYALVFALLLTILPPVAGQQTQAQEATAISLQNAYYVGGSAAGAVTFEGDVQLSVAAGTTLQTGSGNTLVSSTVALVDADTGASFGAYRLTGYLLGEAFSDELEDTVDVTQTMVTNGTTVTAVYLPMTQEDLTSTETSAAPIAAAMLQNYVPAGNTPVDTGRPDGSATVAAKLKLIPGGPIPAYTTVNLTEDALDAQDIQNAYSTLAENIGFSAEVDVAEVPFLTTGDDEQVLGSATLGGTEVVLGSSIQTEDGSDLWVTEIPSADEAILTDLNTLKVYRMDAEGQVTEDEGTYNFMNYSNRLIHVNGVEYTVGAELSTDTEVRQYLYDAEANICGYFDTTDGTSNTFGFVEGRDPYSMPESELPVTQINFFDGAATEGVPSNATYKVYDFDSWNMQVTPPIANTPAVMEYQVVNGSVPQTEDNRYVGMISATNPLTSQPATVFDDVTTLAAAQLSQMGVSATESLKALVAGTYEISDELGAVHRSSIKTFGSNLQTGRSTSALSSMLLSGLQIPVSMICFAPASGVARPVISPDGGTFTEAQQVTITCATPGTEIYYTLDGTDPSRNSIKYTGPFTLSQSATVKAVAVKNTMESKQIAAATFTFTPAAAVATPVIFPAAGQYYGSVEVTLSCATPGASLFYTTDGSTPTARSLPYSGPIRLSKSATVKAIATKAGMTDSAVTGAEFIVRPIGSTDTNFFRPISGGNTCTITFRVNGGIVVPSQRVAYGEKAEKPENPMRAGYTFAGWYTDEQLTALYDFNTAVEDSFTLYAKWREGSWENPFSDVSPEDWFYDAVQFASEQGLVNGVSASSFAPNSYITRAMMVTMLYRAEGNPPVSGTSSFTDVPAGAYYEKAVSWAQQNAIVTGYSDTEFGPDDSITREQIAAIMHRYAGYKAYDTSAAADLSSYTDADAVSEYAVSAMQYAVGSGLIQGKTESTLNPKDFATRAEVVTIFKRFIEANA